MISKGKNNVKVLKTVTYNRTLVVGLVQRLVKVTGVLKGPKGITSLRTDVWVVGTVGDISDSVKDRKIKTEKVS